MMIDSKLANSFIERYSSFLIFTYTNYVESSIPEDFNILKIFSIARGVYNEDRSIFDEFIKEEGETIPLIDDAIQSLKFSQWAYLKDTTKYSLLINPEDECAYAVQGLTDPIKEICGGPGLYLKTGIVQLGDSFVCDGLIEGPIVFFGHNYKYDLNELYKKIKQQKRFYKKPSQLK